MQANPEVLGKLRGVSVKMLVHHSRNSEQKQWDETLVLALAGMARLLKSHLPLLLTFPAFAEVSLDMFHLGAFLHPAWPQIRLCKLQAVARRLTSASLVPRESACLRPDHMFGPCHCLASTCVLSCLVGRAFKIKHDL